MSCIGDFFHSSSLKFFGFHGKKVNSLWDPFAGSEEDSRVKEWNIAVAIGLIPVIGQILAGIKNIVIGLEFAEGAKSRRLLIGRGIAQLCIVTYPILFLVDVIVTLGRLLSSETEGTPEGSEEEGNSNTEEN